VVKTAPASQAGLAARLLSRLSAVMRPLCLMWPPICLPADVARQPVPRRLPSQQVIPDCAKHGGGPRLCKVKLRSREAQGRAGQSEAGQGRKEEFGCLQVQALPVGQSAGLPAGSQQRAAAHTAAAQVSADKAPAGLLLPTALLALTTCAWPRLRNRTVSRRGPTRPPLLALIKTMRGVSATPGPTYALVPTR
jgi:hypothetical protein